MVFGVDFLCDFRVAKGSPKTTYSGQNKGNMVKTSANNLLNVSGLRCLCFDMEGMEISALGTNCILKSLDNCLIIKGFSFF